MSPMLPPLGTLAGAWRLDALGLVFAAPTVVLLVAVAVYAGPYLAQPHYHGESRTRFWLLYALFGAAMVATLAARDLLQFVVCWEVMTLASYVLVAHDTRDPTVVRAAFKYFVMTHAASACLVLAVMVLWARTGTLRVDDLPAALGYLADADPAALHVVLGLLFVAFATKAGLYPLGDWLPDAHPAAPAPVSAVLSGAMVKLGLYGLLRFFAWGLAAAVPETAAVWGMAIATAGAVSALVGGFAASASQDTKVMLAYSSVAQSGLIAIGIGSGLALAPAHPLLAQLALVGALFHAVSDTAVKGLLFLVAGSLQFRLGSRRLEDLGGLFGAMPRTAWTALIASLAIAGFPPLTAFTGKWLMLQATALSADAFTVGVGAALLVASVLSILYAVKFFAAGFLTRAERTGIGDVPVPMQAAQGVLAGAVVLLGVLPGLWLFLVGQALAGMPVPPPPAPSGWGLLGFGPATGAYVPLVLVLGALWAGALARMAVGRAGTVRRVRAWSGGAPELPAMPIHALGFYVPLREPMRRAYAALRFRPLAVSPRLLAALDADRWVFRPAVRTGRRVGAALQRAHSGTAHRYIVWQLVGAALLIILLASTRT
jgi:hydrogenase-4 component B